MLFRKYRQIKDFKSFKPSVLRGWRQYRAFKGLRGKNRLTKDLADCHCCLAQNIKLVGAESSKKAAGEPHI